jgi:hypothetical protein
MNTTYTHRYIQDITGKASTVRIIRKGAYMYSTIIDEW